jgi:ribosomal protein S18 acetylase RimI-like enzyme
VTGGARVEEVVELDGPLVEALARLIPQLSTSAEPLTRAALADMIDSSAITLFVARDDAGALLGSLTLATFRTPTGVRAWIEDVVVEGAARGRGTGGALVEAAVAKAATLGARTVDLTSNPSRTEANSLYQRLGFSVRKTNVYRFIPS